MEIVKKKSLADKRHVIIYANATILGGDSHYSVIGNSSNTSILLL